MVRALRCRAVPCRAVPCGAVPCRAVRCGAVRCSAVRCGAVRYLHGSAHLAFVWQSFGLACLAPQIPSHLRFDHHLQHHSASCCQPRVRPICRECLSHRCAQHGVCSRVCNREDKRSHGQKRRWSNHNDRFHNQKARLGNQNSR